MSAVLAEVPLHPVLERAREKAHAAALPYAGGVPPLGVLYTKSDYVYEEIR